MKHQLKLGLKTAWAVAAIMILLMGTSLCVSTDEACFQAGDAMFSLMFLINFPSGIISLLFTLIFMHGESIHYPAEFMTAWFIMTCGGFLQWFVIVPRIFEKSGLTTLKLDESGPVQPLPSEHRPAGAVRKTVEQASTPGDPSPVELSSPGASKVVSATRARTRPRRRTIKPISAFDGKGRTPLERVFDRS